MEGPIVSREFFGTAGNAKKKFVGRVGNKNSGVVVPPVMNAYDLTKFFNGRAYSGMRVGGKHAWNYDGGVWIEEKIAPDLWRIQFECTKTRFKPAPANSGAKTGTRFHWVILADQVATKLDANSYQTTLGGLKLKAGHQRPHWMHFSYSYPGQQSYRERVIEFLEGVLARLRDPLYRLRDGVGGLSGAYPGAGGSASR
ncbi:MAG: hypothetical protein ACTSU5_11570 [Promethearchaeota archaeon]